MNDNFEHNPFGTGYPSYGFSGDQKPETEDIQNEETVKHEDRAEYNRAEYEAAEHETVKHDTAESEITESEAAEAEIAEAVTKKESDSTIPEWMKRPAEHVTPSHASSGAQTSTYTGINHSASMQDSPIRNEQNRTATESSREGTTYAYSFQRNEQDKPPVTPPPAKPPVKPAQPPKKKKKSGIFKKILLCILLAIIFGGVSGCVFVGVHAIGNKVFGLETEVEKVPEVPTVEPVAPIEKDAGENEADTETAETAASASGELTVAQVAERCMPAMVAITNTSIAEIPSYFGFGSQSYESTSSGSGIIIDQNDEELLIATNNHVISGATSLTVGFIDETLVEAMVKGTDVQNDLAVVSVKLTDIPAETLAKIRVIQIGNSDEMAVGDQVVAIGNALGYGQSVSSGWVSALDREVTIDNTTLTLLQTDAAINPGNSGGALLNMKGELIAINESKYADTSVEGMGYAIPVSTATPILAELMSKTTRYKVDEDQASYIGISCKDISSEFAMMYNVPTGVYVDSVEENGPAALAGIKKGDIITKFDGTTLSSYTDLVSQLEYYAAGESIEVVVYRAHMGEYQEQTLTVTLGARTDSEFLQEGVQP